MKRAVWLAVVLPLATPASAHGLRLTLTAQAGCLSGQIAYSNGRPGEGEAAAVSRADAPSKTVRVVADAQGRFSTKVAPGRYRVKVGDEEHDVAREIDVPAGANAGCGAQPAKPPSKAR